MITARRSNPTDRAIAILTALVLTQAGFSLAADKTPDDPYLPTRKSMAYDADPIILKMVRNFDGFFRKSMDSQYYFEKIEKKLKAELKRKGIQLTPYELGGSYNNPSDARNPREKQLTLNLRLFRNLAGSNNENIGYHVTFDKATGQITIEKEYRPGTWIEDRTRVVARQGARVQIYPNRGKKETIPQSCIDCPDHIAQHESLEHPLAPAADTPAIE